MKRKKCWNYYRPCCDSCLLSRWQLMFQIAKRKIIIQNIKCSICERDNSSFVAVIIVFSLNRLEYVDVLYSYNTIYARTSKCIYSYVLLTMPGHVIVFPPFSAKWYAFCSFFFIINFVILWCASHRIACTWILYVSCQFKHVDFVFHIKQKYCNKSLSLKMHIWNFSTKCIIWKEKNPTHTTAIASHPKNVRVFLKWIKIKARKHYM